MNRSQLTLSLVASTFLLATGCQSDKSSASAPPPVMEKKIIRIKAGASSPVTDSAGNVWLADQGFEGGDTVERAEAEIAGTKDPAISAPSVIRWNHFPGRSPTASIR